MYLETSRHYDFQQPGHETQGLPRSPLAYDPTLDFSYYHALSEGKLNIGKDDLDAYIKRQLVTNLSERFDMPLSVTNYKIRDGQIYGENTDLPFTEMIKRGIDHRQKYGNPLDFSREEAELTGFLKVQAVLTDPKTPLGTVMISVSPRGQEGSSYQRNFVDGMEVKEDETGSRFIESTRYGSSLTLSEFSDRLNQLGEMNAYDGANDAYFLSHPLRVNGISKQQVRSLFANEDGKVTDDEFDFILQQSAPVWEHYRKTMADLDLENALLSFNAGLNIADEALKTYRGGKGTGLRSGNLNEIIDVYGRIPVRQVMVGCGSSSGFDIPNGPVNALRQNSPFSVSEFGKLTDRYGERSFDCPHCGWKNSRPENQLVEKCSHCGGSVRC